MGVCKLFFRIAHYLNENPHQLASASLEDIAAQYCPYAYIGARKHLREFVQEQAQEVGIDPAQWFGTKKWQSDSGAFPDFVLACEPHSPLGNGALLELKDSAGDQIASFNSTLPSARKQISRLTKMVRTAVQNYESKRGCACPDERDCFYLVRTKKKPRRMSPLDSARHFLRDNPQPRTVEIALERPFEAIGCPHKTAQEDTGLPG
jgi:hypothetical protein